MMRPPSIDELEYVEDRRERRGDSLWRVLKERHVSMIAFSGTIGNGLFLGSGRSLASAGPGGAVLSYILVGTVISFAYAILAADEIVAVANTVAFKYDDGRTYINWVVGGEVDAAVWIALFLVIVVAINMLPVKYFGEFEYVFGCFKLMFIVMLIVLMRARVHTMIKLLAPKIGRPHTLSLTNGTE
ncbi:putative Lysine-specific permease [Glarea lozoyensis 74030]|uniref:Putative Lysine-specific permease n=1 Tax=Glarea lozoyensis (strain ATCC 74030 / MF5533) TaxID=1104152 RepID=H0EIA4_GLAL7|nr:putative Lysine-specific permease [Glarea lozoyensis 74030]